MRYGLDDVAPEQSFGALLALPWREAHGPLDVPAGAAGARSVSARSVVALGGALLIGGVVVFALAAEPIPEVRAPAPVVFVCRNGVAMSVWSAAYFNRLASARGLRERAIARAAVPSFTAVPLDMTFALALDGFRLDGYRPAVISADDVRGAEIVVAIDTELPSHLPPGGSSRRGLAGFPADARAVLSVARGSHGEGRRWSSASPRAGAPSPR